MLMMRCRRSPYGERGLKYAQRARLSVACESLSLRRAWIEIERNRNERGKRTGRSPYGERGLKFGRADRSPIDFKVALLTESVD